jgi:hypothetical protein
MVIFALGDAAEAHHLQTLEALVSFLEFDFEDICTDLSGDIAGAGSGVCTAAFGSFVDFDDAVPVVLTVLDAEFAEVLHFAELAEVAAGEADVVVVVAGGRVEGGAEPLFFGFLVLAHEFEVAGGFVGFDAGGKLGLDGLAGLLDEGHEVLVVESQHIDFKQFVAL